MFSFNFSVDYDVNDNVYIKISLFKLAVESLLFCFQFCIFITEYAFYEYFPKVLAEQCRILLFHLFFFFHFPLFLFVAFSFMKNVLFFYRLLFWTRVKLSRNFKYSRWKVVRGALKNRMDQNNNNNNNHISDVEPKRNMKCEVFEKRNSDWIMNYD